jgi:uncharacterized metal-binding protein
MAECCGGGTKLIYACSGAADVGEIADRVARKLRADGVARMSEKIKNTQVTTVTPLQI